MLPKIGMRERAFGEEVGDESRQSSKFASSRSCLPARSHPAVVCMT